MPVETECYALVRGSALRVTGLNKNGSLPDEIQYAVSKSVARVQINERSESGGSETLKSDEEEIRLHFVTNSELIRFTSDIEFLRVDPGVLSLVAGVPLVYNAAGNIVGFDSETKLQAASFAMEVWSNLGGSCQTFTDVVGFGEGGFGDGPFGGGPFESNAPRWGYTVVPFLKGGYLTGFTVANGLVSFNLRGAQTRRGSLWGVGPHDLDENGHRLLQPVSRNTLYRTTLTTGIPPMDLCGIQTTTDVIDGEFVVTSEDAVNGNSVGTSPDVIDGGAAA